MRRAPILAASGFAICMLIAISGCGGSAELSRAEFVKQADAICKEARKKASKDVDNAGDLTSAIAVMLNEEADEIGDLNGPSSDDDQIGAIVDSAREAAAATEASGKGFAKAAPQTEKAEKLAADYGLDECLVS